MKPVGDTVGRRLRAPDRSYEKYTIMTRETGSHKFCVIDTWERSLLSMAENELVGYLK
jgi:hypothetical protein